MVKLARETENLPKNEEGFNFRAKELPSHDVTAVGVCNSKAHCVRRVSCISRVMFALAISTSYISDTILDGDNHIRTHFARSFLIYEGLSCSAVCTHYLIQHNHFSI